MSGQIQIPTIKTDNDALSQVQQNVNKVLRNIHGQIQSFVPPTIQKFLSGKGVYVRPNTSPLYLRVVMVGGGGGGGAATGSSGATPGGTTTFGTNLLMCTGGSDTAGPGGTATINSPAVGLALSGAVGSGLITFVSGGNNGGSPGASTPFGGGGGAGNVSSGTGASGVPNTGAGGGGAGTTVGNAGGDGGSAGGYIDAIITSPAPTYSYAVGIGGTGASGGTGTSGNGGSGIIIVYEYYQ